MCDSGSAQSPIDLNPEQALENGNKIDEGNASISFSNNWWTTDADGELFNNGHTRKKLNQIINFDLNIPIFSKLTLYYTDEYFNVVLKLNSRWT